MPRKKKTAAAVSASPSSPTSIDQIVARASAEIAVAVRAGIAAEVARLVGSGAAAPKRGPGRPPQKAAAPVVAATTAPKRRGRPPKAKPAAAVAPAVAAAPTAKAPKSSKSTTAKRVWPKCTIAGCKNGFFGPSGKEKRLCYEHYLAAGGKHPGKK